MRIGINTLFYIPGEVGGSETYLIETLKAMIALDAGHEFVLFTNREGQAKLFPMFGKMPGVFFQSLEFFAANRPNRILREQIQLPRIARSWRPDVMWSPGYTAPRRCPCPQVVSILDMQYKSHPEDFSCLARFATDVLVQAATRNADRIVAISEFSRAEILEHTHARSEKICVTPLGVDPAFAQPVLRLNDRSTPYILCVANTYPHKNVHSLASAFRRLHSTIPHELVLVGKPRLGEPLLQAELDHHEARERIHRIDRCTNLDLISLYQHADVFVFPSLYEGFGLPVLEAMMSGTPVLTTRCGAIPEVGGDAVAYFDPNRPGDLEHQIVVILKSGKALVEQARQRALTFTWENTARKTLTALQNAIV